MLDSIVARLTASSWSLALAAAIFVASITLSLGVVILVIVRLPADQFCALAPVSRSPGAIARCVGRNVIGWILIVAGAVMSVPGVPGQGLLTIFVGVLLVDFPGKRKVELWFLRRRSILAGVNRIRRRFGRPELTLDERVG